MFCPVHLRVIEPSAMTEHQERGTPMKRSAFRLAGAVAIAASITGVMGAPAFASGHHHHHRHVADADAGNGGTAGNGGNGGIGVNICGIIPVLGNTVDCTAGNGGSGGSSNGGDAAALLGNSFDGE